MNSPDQADYQDDPPKKKGCMGLGWGCWIGIGCVTVLLVCGGGGGALFYFVFNKTKVAYLDAINKAKENQEVQQALGEPIDASKAPPIVTDLHDGRGTTEMRVPLSGSKASGSFMASPFLMEQGGILGPRSGGRQSENRSAEDDF